MQFSLFLLCLTGIQLALAQVQPKTLPEALNISEKYINSIRQAQGMPSLVLGLTGRGRSVYEKAWGYSDLENQAPAKLSTKYRIASL